ncbi:pyridine nucleotide-disulfide oxidoreductase [Candidatus Tenderia electrophaga]|jgi:sulfide:quinone oxidoreductase|uniref:Pyridine nucleotide-disulfide oxidoreductase n=1 Tax=Candidatus Tenderia electrophaga TaxID=1748243 RepID=A0A0S2TF01_9GAMM|nr:pyridine nucleotide-disulfide oxidoreductase [Candidatus Tenderia electrophaga]
MNAQGKTILILGGGIGGVVAASLLRKKLPREHRVVLIEREANHVFAPSFLWLMTGLRTPEKISRPLAKLDKLGIERIQGEIENIDPAKKTVTVGGQEFKCDYLVLALGAELAPDTIPGLAEAGHNLYSLKGAEALREARLQLREGRLVVLVSGVPFKCPAAPYEAAMLLEYDCRKRKVREQLRIDLFTPEPGPMGVAGPEVSTQVRQMVESKGIDYHPEHTVTQVNPEAKQIQFTNGAIADFDLLAYVPPHRASQVVRDAGLTGESGWVPVDRSTLATKFPGIYAIGDVTGIMLSMGKPLPKAGVFAHGEAEVVANNLIHEITGKGNPKVFNGHGECFLESGDGKAGFGSGNFFAEPAPQVKLRQPSRTLHLGKVAFEKYWLFEWF